MINSTERGISNSHFHHFLNPKCLMNNNSPDNKSVTRSNSCGHEILYPFEQRFLSCMAFSIFLKSFAWLVCCMVSLFTPLRYSNLNQMHLVWAALAQLVERLIAVPRWWIPGAGPILRVLHCRK